MEFRNASSDAAERGVLTATPPRDNIEDTTGKPRSGYSGGCRPCCYGLCCLLVLAAVTMVVIAVVVATTYKTPVVQLKNISLPPDVRDGEAVVVNNLTLKGKLLATFVVQNENWFSIRISSAEARGYPDAALATKEPVQAEILHGIVENVKLTTKASTKVDVPLELRLSLNESSPAFPFTKLIASKCAANRNSTSDDQIPMHLLIQLVPSALRFVTIPIRKNITFGCPFNINMLDADPKQTLLAVLNKKAKED